MSTDRVLLVHGAGSSGGTFVDLAAALAARGLRASAPTLPGRPPTGGEPLTTVASMAAHHLERLTEPAIVVGPSLGGAIAIEMALADATGLVAGLVLVSTGARLRVHATILAAMEQAAAGERAGGGLAYHRSTAPDRIAELEARTRDVPPAAALADWRAAHAFDRMADLGAIDCPTIVLAGADDLLTPIKYGRYLADRIRDAELHVVPDAGHMMATERPEAVADAVAALAARDLYRNMPGRKVNRSPHG